MRTQYHCPHCKNTLSIGQDIILTAKNKKGQAGLVVLHTELGNYSSKKSEDLQISPGEEVDLFCPLCNNSIDYKHKTNYANLTRVAEDESLVIFSKIYGQKRTFKVEGKKVNSYGEHALKYTDPEWFL